MGDGAEDEEMGSSSQTCVVPRLEPIVEHRRQEMASLPIPDELMAEILLRLPTTADLARASAASISFRRVATDRPFLRRYRKLHAPPLLGFLEESRDKRQIFHPAVLPPYPSAPEASAASLAADFSFSFLPAPVSDWFVRDIRDGRVVLDKSNWLGSASTVVFPEVVVCDPLHLRYLLLPPITTSVDDPFRLGTNIFLVPPGYGQEAATGNETSFRVIWLGQCKTKLVAFAFSSDTGQWGAVPSRCWSELSAGFPELTEKSLFRLRHYVYGCFYWMAFDCEESKLLVLDIKTMEFSIAKPPPEANSCRDFTMVETGEGTPGMFLLADNRSELSYFIRQNDGVTSSQWQKVKIISLGFVRLICNMEKHLLLFRGMYHGDRSLSNPGCFMLDVETFQLRKVCLLRPTYYELHAYINFPPSLLSSPTISSGYQEGAEKEVLGQGVEAVRGEEPIEADAGGRAGVSRTGHHVD